MRILYITNGISGPGGLERVLSVKTAYLAEQYGYEVHLVSLNESNQDLFYRFSPQIQFHQINATGNPISFFRRYKKGMQQEVSKIDPDIISVCDDGLKGFLLPRIIKTKAKWIYERHVSKLIEGKDNQPFLKNISTRLKWSLMEFLGKKYSKFVVLTKGNKKEWTTLRNLVVIPNPLSFEPSDTADLDNKVVICVGKICYQKRQDLLVDIWKRIHSVHPDWELQLFGQADLNYLDTTRLLKGVRFHPAERNIESKYLESSIYVMPSRFEGFGMVLIEAMACGVPCVSFDCNYGPGDIIQNGEDGYLVPNGDVEGFEEKLLKLMEDTDKRKAFGKKAKENVQRYAVPNIMKQWDDLFTELMSRDERPKPFEEVVPS